jgi:class 3 adenylate cyclase
MLAFESARASLRAAVEIRRSSSAAGLPVRIGIHTGEVVRAGDDFLGITVNKAARVAASADAEIMLSATTRDLVGSMSGIRFGEPRMVALKGLRGVDQVVLVETGAE